ncbi:uncharacterized protein LOC104903437 [Beta vulgaris subsp. vulgaris]|uniref:uncharacterized protein LOC104903437 n=1 Tax=Beta vulgaris subsp. vulgaris TaxID=3555 RepID=UPI002037616E|nr:uncharacterized protein LOC104903437 [Beta vulgaris subsp. vulgaris]
MARTNKYTSLNFNDIYEKKIITPNSTTSTTSTSSRSPSSSLSSHKSYSLSASSRLTHGGMLLLSRPSPKPHPQPQPQPQPQSLASSPPSLKSFDSNSISLRPQGNTGGTPGFQERDNNNNNSKADHPSPSPSPKSNKFVPPHLRPGFVAKEVTAVVPDSNKPKQGTYRPGSAHANYHGSPVRYAEDARPKSGGGYERRMRPPGPGPCPGPGPGFVGRSGGSRPSTSG